MYQRNRTLLKQIFISAIFFLSFFTNVYAATPNVKITVGDEVNGDQVVTEKNVFAKDTAKVYVVATTDAVKKGDSMRATWIAEDTNNAAPANYKIDESTQQVPETPKTDQNFIAKFSLSKPNSGWPVGKYRVDISLNGNVVTAAHFEVR